MVSLQRVNFNPQIYGLAAQRCSTAPLLALLLAETFESADAGASLTYPQQAGTIRKNGYIVINNRPCKVLTQAHASSQRRGSGSSCDLSPKEYAAAGSTAG
jgi:hypothetical protein